MEQDDTGRDETKRPGMKSDESKHSASVGSWQLDGKSKRFDGFVHMHERAVIRQMKTLSYRQYKREMEFLDRAHLALKTRRGLGRGDTKPRPKLRR